MVSSNSNKKKPSVSSQPNTAALVTVAGSELDFYTNSNYLAYELPQYAAALSQGKLGNNDIGDNLSSGSDAEFEIEFEDEETASEVEESGDGDTLTKNAPSLSDIQVISNEVIYDAANNPSVKVVFKIKNSSGMYLKGVNVRVEKK